MKNKFAFLLGFSALFLACIAAYLSINGLAKLFAGAFWTVVVLASGLELSKLVATSYLYRYWAETAKGFKIYMTIGVVTLMLITSAGIYGFLSSAYSVTSNKLSQLDGQIELMQKKKETVQNEAGRIKEIMNNKSNRANALITLRTQQEARVDTLYKKGMITSAKKTEQVIKDANIEVEKLNRQVDSLNSRMQIVLDSAGRIDIQVLELKNNDINGEVGPLKYIAALTGRDMGSVVNFFILILIFICDPMAVCLVIATNKVIMKMESGTPPISELFETRRKQREGEVVKYIENESGEFKKTDEQEVKVEEIPDIEVKLEEIPVAEEEEEEIILTESQPKVNEQEKTKYLEFLEVLFKGGQVDKDDSIPVFKEFVQSLQDKKVVFDENEIKDFLTLCIMLKIIYIDDNQAKGKAIKSYKQAKAIINML